MNNKTVIQSTETPQQVLEKIYLTCDTIDFSIIRKGQLEWIKSRDSYNNDELREYTLAAIKKNIIAIGENRGY